MMHAIDRPIDLSFQFLSPGVDFKCRMSVFSGHQSVVQVWLNKLSTVYVEELA